MKKHVMVDVETLGTKFNSQILSIGACLFNSEGIIVNTFYNVIKLPDDVHVKVTPGTLKFWANQGMELYNLLTDEDAVSMETALLQLSHWIHWTDTRVWANGTKFDIGMLEAVFQSKNMQIPWKYNADRCMRTVREFSKELDIDVEFEGTPHHALDDAIWQAKYVAEACKVLGLKL